MWFNFLTKERLSVGVLILFYLIGLIGMRLNTSFAALTPLNLLLALGLLIWNMPEKTTNQWLSLGFVFLGSFLLEWVGVSTGLIFGAYTYGTNLGFKLGGTPILIGVNWILVVYSSIQVVVYSGIVLQKRIPALIAALLAGMLMVLTDVPIEQVCHKLDFWTWSSPTVPVQNYTAWFFFGVMFSYLGIQFGLHKPNRVAALLYPIQLLFFILLNFLLV